MDERRSAFHIRTCSPLTPLDPPAGTFEQIRSWTPASRAAAAAISRISRWCFWSTWWCASSSSTRAEETWRSASYRPQGHGHSCWLRGDAEHTSTSDRAQLITTLHKSFTVLVVSAFYWLESGNDERVWSCIIHMSAAAHWNRESVQTSRPPACFFKPISVFISIFLNLFFKENALKKTCKYCMHLTVTGTVQQKKTVCL